jgi:hypothetical protein
MSRGEGQEEHKWRKSTTKRYAKGRQISQAKVEEEHGKI